VRIPLRISVSRRLASRPLIQATATAAAASKQTVLQSAARQAHRLAVIGAGVIHAMRNLGGFLQFGSAQTRKPESQNRKKAQRSRLTMRMTDSDDIMMTEANLSS